MVVLLHNLLFLLVFVIHWWKKWHSTNLGHEAVLDAMRRKLATEHRRFKEEQDKGAEDAESNSIDGDVTDLVER